MLVLVRHGQTSANAQGRLSGQVDVELTDLGRRQASAVASAVGVIGQPDVVVTSPLARARQTAAAFGLEPVVDARWTELDYGELDGRPLDAIPGAVWDTWRQDSSFAPPGGESIADMGERVRSAAMGLIEPATDKLVVVVSHVSPIKAAVAWALGVDDRVAWHMFLAPASLTRIGVANGKASLHSFNETVHLVGC